jgi:Tfp pilus assembly protein PilO
MRNIIVIALAVLFVAVLWQRMVYSSMNNQASKAKQATADAETRIKTLQAELNKIDTGDAGAPHTATQEELKNAIPPSPALSSFLRSADTIRAESGVAFTSIVPAAPTAASGVGTVGLGINVQGSYAQVTDYVNRLNKLSRLVLVDSVNFTPGAAEGASTGTGGPTGTVFAGQGAPPMMTIQITARLFTQQGALGAAPGSTGGTATGAVGTASSTANAASSSAANSGTVSNG